MNHRRKRLRRWFQRLLDVRRSPLFVALENVMDRRRRAAVTVRNSADRLTSHIPCRNGVPFALRDFRHLYSWLVCQRPYHAPFQTPLSLAEMRSTKLRYSAPKTGRAVPSANESCIKLDWVRF